MRDQDEIVEYIKTNLLSPGMIMTWGDLASRLDWEHAKGILRDMSPGSDKPVQERFEEVAEPLKRENVLQDMAGYLSYTYENWSDREVYIRTRYKNWFFLMGEDDWVEKLDESLDEDVIDDIRNWLDSQPEVELEDEEEE